MDRPRLLLGVAWLSVLTSCGDDTPKGDHKGGGGSMSGAGSGGSAPTAGVGGTEDGGVDSGGVAAGGSGVGGDSSGSAGVSGGGPRGPGPSCDGLEMNCGASENEDCCASSAIPGGTFNRGNDTRFPATLSPFRLDRFEVTVARLRNFVEAYPGSMPAAGGGKNPNNPNDMGWNATWQLPMTQAELIDGFMCDGPNWTDSPQGNEEQPANCVSWYVAYAFCIWDRGRLPTEAELAFARAGGSEQRPYPWSTSPTDETIDDTFAVFGDTASDFVGSRSPKGDGRWGQADLAGNVSEWSLDGFAALPVPCTDCSIATGAERIAQGGDFRDDAPILLISATRDSLLPADNALTVGFRCARSP